MSKHWHMIDTKKRPVETAAAPTPMEMVLEALGGCTGMDAIAILKKKRTSFTQLDIELTGERAEEHPKSLQILTLNLSCIRKAEKKHCVTSKLP